MKANGEKVLLRELKMTRNKLLVSKVHDTCQAWVQVHGMVIKYKSKYLDIFQVQVQSVYCILKFKYRYMSL